MSMCERCVLFGLYINGLEGYIHLNEFFSVIGHIYAVFTAEQAKTFLLFQCFAVPGVLA